MKIWTVKYWPHFSASGISVASFDSHKDAERWSNIKNDERHQNEGGHYEPSYEGDFEV